MKIIQIIDVRWYNACAHFALQQTSALDQLGHETLLMANPGSPPALMAKKWGLNLSEDMDFSTVNLFKAVSRLKNIIKTFRPDVILAHRGESHLISAFAARGTSLPVARFRGDVRPPKSGIFSRILNEKMTKGIAVSTKRLKRIYEEKYNLNGIPVSVIYPAVSSNRFPQNNNKEKLKQKFGFSSSEIVVGIVGRLSPVKGHKYFLDAAAIVAKDKPNIKFVIAGGDAQLNRDDITKLAYERGLKNLTVLGHINEIEELMLSFDMGVVASIGSEMICRVLLEYYAAGLPVVGTKINQIEEIIIQSGAGILVPPKDPLAMAESIIKLSEDDMLRNSLCKKAKEWVVINCSNLKLGNNTENFLKRVVNG